MWDRQDLEREKQELDENTLKGLLAMFWYGVVKWVSEVGGWDLYKTQK